MTNAYIQTSWTSEEDAVLRAAWIAGQRDKEIQTLIPHRTEKAIAGRRKTLGMAQVKPTRWSEAEMTMLDGLYAMRVPIAEIAAKLGRTEAAVSFKISDSKLNKKAPVKYSLLGPDDARPHSRRDCILHEIELRRMFDIPPEMHREDAADVYRARCEWAIGSEGIPTRYAVDIIVPTSSSIAA